MQHAAREADNAQQFAEVDGQFAAFLFENLPTPEKEVFTQLDEQIALVRTALENNNRSGVQQYYAALCAQTRKKKLSLTAVRRICLARPFVIFFFFFFVFPLRTGSFFAEAAAVRGARSGGCAA